MSRTDAIADLRADILAALDRAHSSSSQPARADRLQAELQASDADMAAALALLIDRRQLQTARIQRRGDEAPWLAIWPTGITVPQNGWTSNNHRWLYDRDQLIRRMPAAPDPDADPRADLSSAARGRERLRG